MARRWPRSSSVRVRATLAAAAAAALCFVAGGLWLRHVLYTDRLRASIDQARSEARGVAASYFNHADHTPFPYVLVSYALVLDDGTPLGSNGDLRRYVDDAGLRLPPNPLQNLGWTGSSVVRLGTPSGAGRQPLDGRTVTLISSIVEVPGDTLAPLLGGRHTGSHQVTVYVLASLLEADAAVAAVDPVLAAGVPVAVALVAILAWLSTGRALRPVEAIRAELADITARNLHRRVPVPGTGDEIARLAETTNATLDRLEEAAGRQRRFIADAAHELRSPLATLRTSLEVALAHPGRRDPAEILGTVLTSARRLERLTEDLLLLARPAALPGQPVDVTALVEEQVAEREHRPGTGVKFRVHAESSAVVQGDEGQLGRLVRNLLDNAHRYARAEVIVTVHTAQGGTVTVEVLDDGPGIPLADRERVFRPFARMDVARSRRAGGTGLGLAIARDIAGRHGGTVVVADSALGARLVITLPGSSRSVRVDSDGSQEARDDADRDGDR